MPAAVASNAANRSTEEHRRSLVQATVFQSVDQLLAKLPTAALLVDWDLKPVCWNAAAVHFCTDRAYSAGSVDGKCRATGHSISALTLPHEIIASCESMRNRRRLRDHSTPRLVARAPVNGRRSQNLDWRASIAMIFFEITPPGRPMFLIEIEAAARSDGSSSQATDAIAQLSACEREVALLVADGCSNGEIARNLGKSVMTVKKQLRSIYQKLKVPNRGRLGALIH